LGKAKKNGKKASSKQSIIQVSKGPDNTRSNQPGGFFVLLDKDVKKTHKGPDSQAAQQPACKNGLPTT
jgi:hypothetical protein